MKPMILLAMLCVASGAGAQSMNVTAPVRRKSVSSFCAMVTSIGVTFGSGIAFFTKICSRYHSDVFSSISQVAYTGSVGTTSTRSVWYAATASPFCTLDSRATPVVGALMVQ